MDHTEEDAHDYRTKSKQKLVEFSVNLLDSSCQRFLLPLRALGQELYDLVIEDLQLVEYDYFDLEYINKDGHTFWLDHLKPLQKQHNAEKHFVYTFVVKFYTPHPNLLEDEFTRYLFALQIRKDLQQGRLPCSDATAALLCAYIVQSQIGDFQEDLYTDHTYLSNLHGLPVDNAELLMKIMECHRNIIGQTPAEADFNLLDTARKVELYGIRMHPAKDTAGIKLNLSVSHAGVLVYQGNAKINTFSWARVRKLSFKRRRFYVKLHPDVYNTAEFVFESRDECKNFWKRCIEHHAFFRCQAVRQKPDRRGRMVSKGSSFRYTGRTQKQLIEYVQENYIKLNNFERSSSARLMNSPTPTMGSARLGTLRTSHGHILDTGVHSDFGPSVKLRERPSTDPAQRTLLTDSQLSPYVSHPFAIAIPLIPSSSGYQTIQGSTVRQRRPLLPGNEQSSLPRTAYLLPSWAQASSGSYTMNSPASAGSPDVANSPSGSPAKQQLPTSANYATQFILPNQLRLQDITLKPIPVSQFGAGQSAGMSTGIVQPTQIGSIVRGNLQTAMISPVPQSVIMPGFPKDLQASMHSSFIVTAPGPDRTNFGQSSPTLTGSIAQSSSQTVSSEQPNRTQPIYIRPPFVLNPNRFPHQQQQQVRFPGAYAFLASPPGTNPMTEGRVVYIDRKTGRPFLPVLAPGGPMLTTKAVQPSSYLPIESNAVKATSIQAPASESSDMAIQVSAHVSTETTPTQVIRNGVKSRPTRSGPPPPAPQRRDSILQRPPSTSSQRFSLTVDPQETSSNAVTPTGNASDASSQNSHRLTNPMAAGLITKIGGLNSASCLSLAARGRSALSTRSLCGNATDSSDEAELDSRRHSDAEATNEQADDTGRRASFSQFGSSRCRSSSVCRRSRDPMSIKETDGETVIRPGILKNPLKRPVQDPTDGIYHVIHDMVMTEKTYGRDLSIICVHFRQEVTNSSKELFKDRLSFELSNRIFSLLDPIYHGHQQLLATLEARLNSWNQSGDIQSGEKTTLANGDHFPCRVGDLFLKLEELFPAVQQYLGETEQVILAIENEVQTNPSVEQAMRRFEAQKLCYLPFYVFLLKPMRRLLQYRATLERLMRQYGDSLPDAPDCRMVHARLLDLIQSRWEAYRRVENTYKLLEIQRDLIGLNPTGSEQRKPNLGPLVQPGRQFIREGWLQKLSKKSYQPRMFFLFSDQLIYASRTSASFLQFKVHGQFPLYDLMVEEAEPEHSFTVFSGNLCFLVTAPSEWQRDRWLEDISRAILAAKTKPGTEQPAQSNLHTNGLLNESEKEAPPTDPSQVLQRATTSVHVCWHRNYTYSMQDILRANEYETSGYLLRKFKNSRGWQRLWVVFTQNCLFFYKSYRDENPLASLPLAGYLVNTPGPDDPIRREGVIKLHFKNHVYYFRGESQLSFDKWLENLSTAGEANR